MKFVSIISMIVFSFVLAACGSNKVTNSEVSAVYSAWAKSKRTGYKLSGTGSNCYLAYGNAVLACQKAVLGEVCVPVQGTCRRVK